ncbi:MAG: hypothetical protein PVF23_07605, partial [Chromatiales bacterium]
MRSYPAIASLMAALLASAPLFAADEDNAERMRALRAEVKEVTVELKAAQKERETEVAALRETEQQISRHTARLRQTEQEIESVASRREELLKTLGPVEKRLASQKQLLRQQVLASYRMGRQQRLKLLLNQDDPARLSRILSYYDYLNQARAGIIADIEDSYRTLIETGKRIRADEARLSTLRDEQQELLASVEEARDQRKQALAEREKQIARADKRLATLREDVAQLEELTRKLAEVAPPPVPASIPFKSRKGKLP